MEVNTWFQQADHKTGKIIHCCQ